MRRIMVAWLTGVLALATARAATPPLPEVWLAPMDRSQNVQGVGSTDYMRLFAEPDTWPVLAQHTAVFKLYPYFAGRASDDTLRQVIAWLGQHHILLALEARALTDSGPCKGDGGENTVRLLARLKRLGAELHYLAMDEPLKHWRFYKGGCGASFQQIAANIAQNVRGFRAIYPALVVGDIEPVGRFDSDPALVSDLAAFLAAYRTAMGEPIGFFHADVTWRLPWLDTLMQLGTRLHAQGVRFGVIYNGEDLAASDHEWAQQASSHAEAFEHAWHHAPDTVLFQSWVAHPTRDLPEDDADSLTGIALRYLRQH